MTCNIKIALIVTYVLLSHLSFRTDMNSVHYGSASEETLKTFSQFPSILLLRTPPTVFSLFTSRLGWNPQFVVRFMWTSSMVAMAPVFLLSWKKTTPLGNWCRYSWGWNQILKVPWISLIMENLSKRIRRWLSFRWSLEPPLSPTRDAVEVNKTQKHRCSHHSFSISYLLIQPNPVVYQINYIKVLFFHVVKLNLNHRF